jgi:hypothetical protein
MGYCSAARIGMCAETDAASRSAGMLLLNQLKHELPEQAPPGITADADTAFGHFRSAPLCWSSWRLPAGLPL